MMVINDGYYQEPEKPNINGISLEQIRLVEAVKYADNRFPDKVSYKIRIHSKDGCTADIKVLKDRSTALEYINDIAVQLREADSDIAVLTTI